MTNIRLTDPQNLVQVAIYRIGGYEKVATLTGAALSTVKQWRYTSSIPLEHIPALATASKMDHFLLYQYIKKHGNVTKAKEKPSTVIDDLINGHPTGLDPRTEKLLKTRYPKEKLVLLKGLFQRVSQHYDSQAEYTCVIDHSAQALGTTRHHFFRLMRLFSVKRQEFGTQQREKTRKQDTQDRRERQLELALAVIRGVITAKDGAATLDLAYRHFFRIIEAALAEYPGYQVNTLRRLPRLLRLSIAHEIENKVPPLSLKLKALYDEHYDAKVTYKVPEDLVHAPFKDKLIAVLDGDMELGALTSATGIKPNDLKTFFNQQLRVFGLSYDEISARSVYHQLFLADILKHSNQ